MVLSEEQILVTLTDVFRQYGYEGASLAAIAEATGLAKASLYHRFPGGKAQMAEAVMDRARVWLDTVALVPLRDQSLPIRDRVLAMTRQLDAFYQSGEKSCLLDALSIGEAGSALRRMTRDALDLWAGELAAAVAAAGYDDEVAARRAERAITLIQGALIVSRIKGDPAPFRRVLAELPEQLLGG